MKKAKKFNPIGKKVKKGKNSLDLDGGTCHC